MYCNYDNENVTHRRHHHNKCKKYKLQLLKNSSKLIIENILYEFITATQKYKMRYHKYIKIKINSKKNKQIIYISIMMKLKNVYEYIY